MRSLILSSLAISAAALGAQQRPIVDASPSMLAYSDARISPDGQSIAYRVGNQIAVTDANGLVETVLVSGTTLGTFLWAPTSTTVYLVDGNRVLAANRRGGTPTQVATVPGNTVELADIDAAGATLYGTRYVAATQTYHLFSLRSSGTGSPTDLVSSQDRLADVAIDPTDTWMLFTQQATAPFSPVSVMRAGVDGRNVSDLLGAPLGTFVERPDWIDAGDTAVCAAATTAGTQIVRIDRLTQTMVPLTHAGTHKSPTVSADRRWIVCTAVDGIGGNGPALLPTVGGGVVHLYTQQPYTYTSPPTIGGATGRIAFSAQRSNQTEFSKLWRLDLDGEVRVSPRVEINRVTTLEVPTAAGEWGALFIGQRNATPFTLPGINFDFNLGGAAPLLGFGPGMNGAWVFQLPLPNLPFLQGIRVDFQGFRVDPATNAAEFTRFGGMSIF
ncbi:MAG: hypothetical protein IPM29_23765 [Planctomycetes bacterium]|nr:hypothetical protein [Planctomycetota bacterium]